MWKHCEPVNFEDSPNLLDVSEVRFELGCEVADVVDDVDLQVASDDRAANSQSFELRNAFWKFLKACKKAFKLTKVFT